jgi:hypothetical protein
MTTTTAESSVSPMAHDTSPGGGVASRVELLDHHLTVTFSGMTRVLALRKRLSLRYEAIDTVELGAARVYPSWTPRVGYAMPVSPRRHGTFYAHGKHFFDIRDREHAVTLRLKPGAEWKTVTLAADDPAALAARIRERVEIHRR